MTPDDQDKLREGNPFTEGEDVIDIDAPTESSELYQGVAHETLSQEAQSIDDSLGIDDADFEDFPEIEDMESLDWDSESFDETDDLTEKDDFYDLEDSGRSSRLKKGAMPALLLIASVGIGVYIIMNPAILGGRSKQVSSPVTVNAQQGIGNESPHRLQEIAEMDGDMPLPQPIASVNQIPRPPGDLDSGFWGATGNSKPAEGVTPDSWQEFKDSLSAQGSPAESIEQDTELADITAIVETANDQAEALESAGSAEITEIAQMPETQLEEVAETLAFPTVTEIIEITGGIETTENINAAEAVPPLELIDMPLISDAEIIKTPERAEEKAEADPDTDTSRADVPALMSMTEMADKMAKAPEATPEDNVSAAEDRPITNSAPVETLTVSEEPVIKEDTAQVDTVTQAETLSAAAEDVTPTVAENVEDSVFPEISEPIRQATPAVPPTESPDAKNIFPEIEQIVARPSNNRVQEQVSGEAIAAATATNASPPAKPAPGKVDAQGGTYYDSRLNAPAGTINALNRLPRKPDGASKIVQVSQDHIQGDFESRVVAAGRALRLQRYDAAADMYDELYKKNSRDLRILMGRAVAHQNLGRSEIALRTYEELLDIEPDNADALVNMLGILRQQYPEVALRRLILLHEKYPGRAGIAAQLGIMEADTGNLGDAMRYLGMAASIEPNNAQHLLNMAIVSDRSGDVNAAIKYYQQALEVDSIYGSGRSISREQIYDRLSTLRRRL